MATTLKAMSRISEIRQKREKAFYQKRMAKNGEKLRADDLKEVERNIMLVGAPLERERLKVVLKEREDAIKDVEMA